MRTLASIQRITALDPIPDADAIECASVLGWKVVVKKGEYQVGDLAVYMEIDSVPPDEEQYRFLWRFAEQRPNNFRIKTIKLRGQISQGILFPCDALLPMQMTNPPKIGLDEGTDVTEILGVTKYEAPLPRGADDIAGQFFDGVPKTDEERVQSQTGRRLLDALQGRPYYITVKCDGSSMTVAMHDSYAKVASRNYRLTDTPDSSYWRAARANNDALLDCVVEQPWLAIQGELVGPGIQNNRLGLSEPRCLVFTIFDRSIGVRLSWVEMKEMADTWGFDLVPLVVPPTHGFNLTQEDLLVLAEGKYEGTTSEREGIVIRSADPFDNISFKAISNRYLLKGGE